MRVPRSSKPDYDDADLRTAQTPFRGSLVVGCSKTKSEPRNSEPLFDLLPYYSFED